MLGRALRTCVSPVVRPHLLPELYGDACHVASRHDFYGISGVPHVPQGSEPHANRNRGARARGVARWSVSAHATQALPITWLAQHAVDRLLIHCSNGVKEVKGDWVVDKEGCDVIMSSGDMAGHEASCGFARMACDFAGCNELFFRKDVDEHNTKFALVHAEGERKERERLEIKVKDLNSLISDCMAAMGSRRVTIFDTRRLGFKVINVITASTIKQHIVRGHFKGLFDNMMHDLCLEVPENFRFSSLRKILALVTDISVEEQQFWLFSRRANTSFLPHRVLTAEEICGPVSGLVNTNTPECNFCSLFLDNTGERHLNDKVLLFFKVYDSAEKTLVFGHYTIVTRTLRLRDALREISSLSFAYDLCMEMSTGDLSKCVLLRLEDTPSRELDPALSIVGNELENGDVIIISY